MFRQLTDRECELDIALLRCGKLCEGLESFREWLSDVESRQSKQKPFSIDHKALRPQQQIQEVYTKNRTPETFYYNFAKIALI